MSKKDKLTKKDLIDLIIKAVLAIAALITAIKSYRGARDPPPFKGIIYNIPQKGGLFKLKRNDFFTLSLVVFLIIGVVSNWNPFIKAVVIINSVVVLVDVIYTMWRNCHE